jgi:hypothetical protein
MEQYTYILAPHTAHNFAVVQQAIAGFPDLVDNRQIGRATPKSESDVLDFDGGLLVAQSNEQYIYVKADTLELDASGLLDYVQDYQLFTVDTQPKETFWLNVQ